MIDSSNGANHSENLSFGMTHSHASEGLSHSTAAVECHSPNMAQHHSSNEEEEEEDEGNGVFSTTPMTTHAHFLLARGSSVESPPHRRQRSHSWGGDRAVVEAFEQEEQQRTSLWLPNLATLAFSEEGILAPASSLTGASEEERRKLLVDSSTAVCSTAAAMSRDEEDATRRPYVLPKKVPPAMHSNSWPICILYGIIHATIVIPVIFSFATIIYRDPIFAPPYLHSLLQLTLLSSMVHQLVFCTCSKLPFAIGQVQDAGLIFLSNMATTIVQHFLTDHADEEENAMPRLLATTTFALSLATALLGLSLMVLGHFRLAQYVQLLPTCVVGGYLAYIGWFCGHAGLDLMWSSVPKATEDLWISSTQLNYLLPGVLGGAFIYLAIRNVQHMATLPACISLEFILFYFVLYMTNTSIEDATAQGWIRSSGISNSASSDTAFSQTPMWYHTWDYILRFDLIDWKVLPMLWPNLLGMVFVVALSSSLDVAAIEIELNQSLNYNHELQMIGMSNMISGCTGGYTGSYIFSQTIFSLRAGIRSRRVGFVLAFCEMLIFMTPIPILSYIPNFLFGSLLFMICIDLMVEWLWHVRHRFTTAEYMLCLSTFGLIQWLNVEYGIVAGIVLYLVLQQAGCNVGVSKFVSTNDREQASIVDAFANEDDTSKTTNVGPHRPGSSVPIATAGSYGSVQ